MSGVLGEQFDTVVAAWTGDPGFAPLTVERMREVLRRFVRYVDANGYGSLTVLDPAVCDRFVRAPVRSGQPPAAQTMHFRRTTIRTTLRTLRSLGVDAPDPTIDIALPPRGGVRLRPLTDDEIAMCRVAAFAPNATDLKRPAAWAIAEATGTTADLTATTTDHIEPTPSGMTIRFEPSRTAAARSVAATGWGETVLTRRLDELNTGARICYDGTKPARTGSAQAATCGLLGTVLLVTGLSRDPAVRPGSVRLWRIDHEFRTTGSFEHAARIAGARSLDTLAHQLAHDWTER